MSNPVGASPVLSLDEAAAISAGLFGLSVDRVTSLGSCQDANFRVRVKNAKVSYVLKVSNLSFGESELDLQNQAMQHLAQQLKGTMSSVQIPSPIKRVAAVFPVGSATTAPQSEFIGCALIGTARVPHLVRCLTFIEGTILSDLEYLSKRSLFDIGVLVGSVGIALREFQHAAADRVLQFDLKHAKQLLVDFAPFVPDVNDRQRLIQASNLAWHCIDKCSPSFRSQVIHADLAHYNLVVSGCIASGDNAGSSAALLPPTLSGVIDFGDVIRSWAVADLATAVASLLVRHSERGLNAALIETCHVVAGYNSVCPLNDAELTALWPLVLVRAIVLVASVENLCALDPGNAYNVEERAIDWLIFDRVSAIPFPLAEAAIRFACSKSRGNQTVANWLHKLPSASTNAATLAIPIDFSIASDLFVDGNWRTVAGLTAAIRTWERQQAASRNLNVKNVVALGAWGEARQFHTREQSLRETPTVHLGVDVFVRAGTRVVAPCDVRVLSVDTQTCSMLLSASSHVAIRLAGVQSVVSVGATVSAGSMLATVCLSNNPSTLLPAHLHVQLIEADTNDLAFLRSVPGLAEPSLAGAWSSLCPDPSALVPLLLPSIRLDQHALSNAQQRAFSKVGFNAGGAASYQALTNRRNSVASVQEHYFEHPPQIERGFCEYMYGTDGRAYLDVVNNVTVLGHAHPAVRNALNRQLSKLCTNSRFVYTALGDYARAIVDRMPKGSGLDSVFFVNSGSEAVDLALRIARATTGRQDVLCMEGGYHGVTTATDQISTTLNDNPNSRDSRPKFIHLCPMPNLYRGKFRADPNNQTEVDTAVGQYVNAVQEILDKLQSNGGAPACFVAEPLSGNAGGVEIPYGYLKRVYQAVRARGGVCIADEVQVGLGRLGTQYWGFMEHDVMPDIVTMAKAAGNGHPLGFVVTTGARAKAFSAEGSFFSSAGGNPVSCAVGKAVLDTIDADQLQSNAVTVGAHLSKRFRELARRWPNVIGCCHGHGMYQGLEIVTDAKSKAPATKAASAITDRLLELGVACHATGDYSNVLKCKPPLCMSIASANHYANALEVVLNERCGPGLTAKL